MKDYLIFNSYEYNKSTLFNHIILFQIKQRTKRLSELFSSYEPYSGLEGSVFDVLVTEEAFDNQHYVGHNKLYQQVIMDRYKF